MLLFAAMRLLINVTRGFLILLTMFPPPTLPPCVRNNGHNQHPHLRLSSLHCHSSFQRWSVKSSSIKKKAEVTHIKRF